MQRLVWPDPSIRYAVFILRVRRCGSAFVFFAPGKIVIAKIGMGYTATPLLAIVSTYELRG